MFFLIIKEQNVFIFYFVYILPYQKLLFCDYVRKQLKIDNMNSSKCLTTRAVMR